MTASSVSAQDPNSFEEPALRSTVTSPTVGIMGGGQLGRMMAAAALRLGVETRILQTDRSGPADGLARVFTGDWHDESTVSRFAAECDVITFENEWVELDTLMRVMPPWTKLWPTADAMAGVRDKIRQKNLAKAEGLPVGEFRACATLDEARDAAQAFGYPVLFKRPTHSYDGYGNRTVEGEADVQGAYEALADGGRVLVEKFVPFERELAVLVARSVSGEVVTYPVAATVQKNHRCEAVELPAPIPAAVDQLASELARRTAVVYGVVGIAGVELFQLADGTLLVNEIAPRPHNTGHYTIDACVTSQFENHIRAVLDYPLGDPSLIAPATVMVNVLGKREGATSLEHLPAALGVPGANVHLYGKREVRPGRKMGHVTVVGDTLEDVRKRANMAAERLLL